MNLKSSEPEYGSAADEAASLWAARIEGSTLDAADRDALDAWLAADPAHRVALSRYCQFSADLEQRIPALAAAGLVEVPRPRRREPAPAFRGLGWLAAGAFAAAAFVAVFRVFSPTDAAPQVQGVAYAAGAGEQRTVQLADGSVAILNAQTTLEFVNLPAERRVRLASGEAFFSVARMTPAVPFVVESPAGSVRVTGTRFSVRAESAAAIEVLVEEGSVEVAAAPAAGGAAAGPTALKAGDRLRAAGSSVSVLPLSESEVARALRWREGIAEFTGTPLVEAAARFARFNGRDIRVAPDVARRGVQSRFDLKDLDGFLQMAADNLDVRVTRQADGSINLDAKP